MRHCPHCQQVYDDSLNFCLSDGTPLASGSNPDPETVIISSPVVSHGRQFAKPGVNPIFAYLSIGLIALLVGGGLVLWLRTDRTASLNANNTPVTTVSPLNEQPKPALSSQSNTRRQEQENPEREERRSTDAPKNTSSPPAPSLPRSSNGTWFVILGSYPKNDRGKADQRLRYVQGLGYDASIVDSANYPGFRGGLYCVVVGPYSKSDAKGLLGRMKSSVSDAYIKSGW